MVAESKQPQAEFRSLSRLAQSMKVSNDADIDLIDADEPDNEFLGCNKTNTTFFCSDEADESANTFDGEENL